MASPTGGLFLHSDWLQRETLCQGVSMGMDSGQLNCESQVAMVGAGKVPCLSFPLCDMPLLPDSLGCWEDLLR